MYTNLQQFEDEKVKEYLALPLGTREGHADFLRTAIRQAGELTVGQILDGDIRKILKEEWLSNEQPQ